MGIEERKLGTQFKNLLVERLIKCPIENRICQLVICLFLNSDFLTDSLGKMERALRNH